MKKEPGLAIFGIIASKAKEFVMKREYEKMIAGEMYRPQDLELRQLVERSRDFQYAFNAERDGAKRVALVKDWFGSTGENL